MNKRYEFVQGDEIVIAPGRTAKRIRALLTIAALGITPGDFGGYIESEKNLSQVSGDAWVFGDARVYGDAQVYGDAWVSGNARVYGNAQVFGDAQVSGDAWVSDDAAIIWFSRVGTANGTLTVFRGKADTFLATRDCFLGTIDEFLGKSEAEHDDRTHLEYRLLIEVAHSRLTRGAI